MVTRILPGRCFLFSQRRHRASVTVHSGDVRAREGTSTAFSSRSPSQLRHSQLHLICGSGGANSSSEPYVRKSTRPSRKHMQSTAITDGRAKGCPVNDL